MSYLVFEEEGIVDKADLVKIKEALERDTIKEACLAMEKVLLELGYYLAIPSQ